MTLQLLTCYPLYHYISYVPISGIQHFSSKTVDLVTVVISCTTQHFSHFSPSAFGIFPRVDVLTSRIHLVLLRVMTAYARRQSTGFVSLTGVH